MGKSKKEGKAQAVKEIPSQSPTPKPQETAPEEVPELDKKCALPDCPSPAQSRCSGCQGVGYCSKEHQKQHWKQHKGACLAWKVGENKRLGRFLQAVRDVRPGEIVIREKPLLITPPKITLPVCLGCYSEFKPDGAETDDGRGVKPYACRNGCGWPMCKSALCSGSKDHEAECKMAIHRGTVKIRSADIEHPIYQLVALLRALWMKDKDPSAFEKLMSLEGNVEKREEHHRQMEKDGGNPFSAGREAEVKASVAKNLLQDFFKREDVSEEWVAQVFGILETNGHEIPIPDQDGHINRRIIGVYHTSSFIEHNCVPNCVKTWDLSSKEIIIRAATHIKKGDHFSISYVDPLWGTQDRVSLLKMTKFFTCLCSRCKDPSELGLNISSLRCHHLKCTEKGKGMIQPCDPYKPEGDWKCKSCGEDYTPAYVSNLLHQAGQELEEMNSNVGDVEAKEEFLKRFGKSLAPNHYYLLEVRVELAQLYGRTEPEPLHLLPPIKLLRKILLCEELMMVLNVISPGYNRLRALILYELQAGVLMLSRMRHGVGEISLEKHLEELMQCGKWMVEVIKVLGWESVNSIERKRAVGAERDLEHLRSSVLALQQDLEPSPSPNPQANGQEASSAKKEKEKPKGPEVGKVERSHVPVDEDSFIEEVF